MDKYLINVVPATKISLGRSQVFSYLTDKKLKAGQLVEIPFGYRKIYGIVINDAKKALPFRLRGSQEQKYRLKNIYKVIDEKIVLTKEQIRLAQWISKYYHVSLGLTVKMMLPKRVKLGGKKTINTENSEKTQSSQRKSLTVPTIPASYMFKKNIKLLDKPPRTDYSKPNVYLLHETNNFIRTAIYLKAIDKIIKRNKQIIVLTPEISITPKITDFYKKYFGSSKVSVLHSQMSDGERFMQWQYIRDQQSKIIIGPRSAIFAPTQNLGLIILDQEHDPSYKQWDQMPRYHAKNVALKLGEILKIPIILGSATPSIESYYFAKKNKYKLIKIDPQIKNKNQKNISNVSVADMRNELLKGNKSIFSEDLLENIKNVLSKNGRIILFINRRGASTFVMCRDCGFVIKCPKCRIPLTYHLLSQKELKSFHRLSTLICHHCNYIQTIPELCPKCQGHRIKYFGIGTQKVEEEIKKIFPQKNIVRIDSDAAIKNNVYRNIYQNFINHKIDILIGTQMVAREWNLPKVDLVGIISADVGLNMPNFQASERTFQLMTHIAKLGNKTILQTYNPEHFVIKAVKKNNYEMFFKKEINARKMLYYPPFSRIIKLIYVSDEPDKAEKETKRIYKKLELLILNFKLSVSILGPIQILTSQTKEKYIWHIILKGKNPHKLLEKVPSDWKVDVDPISLL